MKTEFLRGTNGFAFDFSKVINYMNREKEIVQQSIKEFPRFAERRVGFIIGAKWSDEHPKEGLWDSEKVCKFIKDYAPIDYDCDGFIEKLKQTMIQ